MNFKTWLVYTITELLLIITPGPAVLLVSSQGLKYGARPSYFGALGVSGGNTTYFILSAFGLGAVIATADTLFEIIKAAGALYLVLSGFRMIYSSFRDKISGYNDTAAPARSNFRSFLQGFITQAANPKAIVFFVALLPQFINPEGNIPLQFFILGATTLVLETGILMCYGWLAAKGKAMAGQNAAFRKWQDRASGSVLVLLGVNLFLIRR